MPIFTPKTETTKESEVLKPATPKVPAPEVPNVVDNSAQEAEARTRRLKALGYV
jgi:hypothetical protein